MIRNGPPLKPTLNRVFGLYKYSYGPTHHCTPRTHPPTVSSMATTLQHAELGEIRGNTVDGVVQFLGLKYATLKDRLASPELLDSYGPGPTDATKFG